MQETNNIETNKKTDEIDLIEVFKKIWAERILIFKTVSLCLIFGFIYIMMTPKEYKSETKLLIETSSKNGAMTGMLSQLGGLAGLSGLGGGSSEGGITPTLYPDIIKSTPFLCEVVNKEIKFIKRNDTLKITLESFLKDYYNLSFTEKVIKYTIGLPSTIISSFSDKTEKMFIPQYHGELNPITAEACGKLSGRIKVKDGEVAGTLNVSVEMQDPMVAAQVTEIVVKSLTEYIVKYRTQKTKTDLEFIEKQYIEAKIKFQNAQQTLAEYQDNNKNIILASSRTEEDRLRSEFSLKQGLYSSFAQQLENKKIDLQENTPLFSIIEPVKPNFAAEKPKKGLILLVVAFLGGFVGLGIVLINIIRTKLL